MKLRQALEAAGPRGYISLPKFNGSMVALSSGGVFFLSEDASTEMPITISDDDLCSQDWFVADSANSPTSGSERSSAQEMERPTVYLKGQIYWASEAEAAAFNKGLALGNERANERERLGYAAGRTDEKAEQERDRELSGCGAVPK